MSPKCRSGTHRSDTPKSDADQPQTRPIDRSRSVSDGRDYAQSDKHERGWVVARDAVTGALRPISS